MKNNIFYGWFVAAACFIFAVTTLGLMNGTSNLYIKPICDELGFSRGAFSLVFSILAIFSVVSCISFGTIQKKVGVRKIFAIGMLCTSGAYTLYSFSKSLYTFYAGAALMGIGIVCTGVLPLSVTVSSWFLEKRGTVLGAVLAGGGVGGTIMNPLVGKWISEYGWRISYVYSMLTVVILCVPALFFLRNKPSDLGLAAYGANKSGVQDAMSRPAVVAGLTLKEARKTTYFWYVIIGVFLSGFSIQPVYINSSAHLAEIGLKPQLVALVAGSIYFSTTFAKIFLGIVNDKFGVKYIVVTSNLFFVIAAICLIFSRTGLLGFAFGIAFGVAYCMFSVVTPLTITSLFGQKDYGSLLGLFMAVQTVGYSIGTAAAGYSFDIFHTYVYAFAAEAVLDIAAASLILTALLTATGKSQALREPT